MYWARAAPFLRRFSASRSRHVGLSQGPSPLRPRPGVPTPPASHPPKPATEGREGRRAKLPLDEWVMCRDGQGRGGEDAHFRRTGVMAVSEACRMQLAAYIREAPHLQGELRCIHSTACPAGSEEDDEPDPRPVRESVLCVQTGTGEDDSEEYVHIRRRTPGLQVVACNDHLLAFTSAHRELRAFCHRGPVCRRLTGTAREAIPLLR